MLYPRSFEEKLGFDRIRSIIKENCLSPLGMAYVEKMRFSKNFDQLQTWLQQTEEFRRILTSGESFPNANYIDATSGLDKASLQGTFLTQEEFFDLLLALKTIEGIVRFLKSNAEEYPLLSDISGAVFFNQQLVHQIEAKIDDKGQLRNNASAELQQIRAKIQGQQVQLRRVLDRILREAKAKGYTKDDVTPTIRDGRMVIPVSVAYKRSIKGFVHDESATGQTVYLEPAEVLEVNNSIRELEYEERREIVRILTVLTDALRPELDSLRKAFRFLGLVDFIRAKAKFAVKLEAHMPELHNRTLVEWYNSRHPLLWMAHQEQGKPVVPLNIRLSQQQRILVISGPNAGGKSVCVKTVGLVQYMMQCGLLVPMDGHSKMGIFQNVFLDIGDEQSIDNDLSTYSSHLTNMRHFVNNGNKRTLILIDEFGTGTEPQFGGAIAESLLSQFAEMGMYGVINTHYGNLKRFADKTKGLVNGAMRFDLEKLEPLYDLEIGKPGSSFALEIARKIGLPKEVLKDAQGLVGVDQVKLDRMLGQLESDKRKLEEKLKKAEDRDRRLKLRMEEYEDLKARLDDKRRDLIDDAKREAKGIMEGANRRVEAAIKEIKEKKASKEKTKEVREQLEKYKGNIKIGQRKTPAAEVKEPEFVVEGGTIKVGNYVRVKDSGTIGEVLGVRGKDLELSLGGLKTTVKMNRVEKVSRRVQKKEEKERSSRVSMKGIDINAKMSNYTANLDIRGRRGEEIFFDVQNFVDEGAMLGFDELRIVHGKGDGILRDVVRNILDTMSQVRAYKDEHVERGGAGVTVVHIK
ncbi:endonuclease MutS2 [Persicobacter sp. CCB-QB2]|uniref:endonuclease MutS2 n=1 Tax=Persicobacter sp. CCB-QB2 TaxID=1561025 RepID=UPI0006A9C319|nr:endonuclease MutS2 [Persicobacter sp. CCB-QB2]